MINKSNKKIYILITQIGVTQIAELLVSIKRLQKFMLYEELEETSKKTEECKNERSKDDQNDVNKVEKDTNDVKSTDVETNNQTEYILSLRNANCKWLVHDQEDTLKNININVKSGELIAVVGQVGSGKSSLLNVILKELPLNSGIIEVCIVSSIIVSCLCNLPHSDRYDTSYQYDS